MNSEYKITQQRDSIHFVCRGPKPADLPLLVPAQIPMCQLLAQGAGTEGAEEAQQNFLGNGSGILRSRENGEFFNSLGLTP